MRFIDLKNRGRNPRFEGLINLIFTLELGYNYFIARSYGWELQPSFKPAPAQQAPPKQSGS